MTPTAPPPADPPPAAPPPAAPHPAPSAADALIARIRDSVIGERDAIPGPYGPRPLVYADYVASGRPLGFLERAIAAQVLPIYGNTHTEASHTGRETTRLREAARATIAAAVGAGPDHAVIFAGSGATGAIDRLVRGMDLAAECRAGRRPVVFVGPYEHHSNDLPWRETGAVIERIALAPDGGISLAHLAERLAAHPEKVVKVGAFSAASNVTGKRSDLPALARFLHRHGAVFVCDFAAAAPYVDMRLHPDPADPLARIDAIVFSPHKFPGGPGASGVLIAERTLFTARRPGVPGGGTVSYVAPDRHAYVTDLEQREEGGTPAILGDIRAGAVVALKEAVGAAEIERREAEITARVMATLAQEPGIEVLGPAGADRLGIVSFNIRAGARQLHYGFVVALLNDLFGIQARGGCSCAGPYGHALLDISPELSRAYETALAHGNALLRPGWVRVGFPYFLDDATVAYILAALRFVARHGTRFLPDYSADPVHGPWRHRTAAPAPAATLEAFWAPPVETGAPPHAPDLAACLAAADALAAARARPTLCPRQVLDKTDESLRWFWLPQETAEVSGHETTSAPPPRAARAEGAQR